MTTNEASQMDNEPFVYNDGGRWFVMLGSKKRKFKSIREACEYTGQDYMRTYMRIRRGMKPSKALALSARKYRKAV